MIAEGAEILEALAEVSEDLIRVANEHRDRPGVRRITTTTDIRRFASGGAVGLVLEAETEDGSVVCWSVDIGWAPQWTIGLSVTINDAPEQRRLAGFPELQPKDSAEARAAMRDLTGAIRTSVAGFDFARKQWRVEPRAHVAAS